MEAELERKLRLHGQEHLVQSYEKGGLHKYDVQSKPFHKCEDFEPLDYLFKQLQKTNFVPIM